MPAPAGSYVVQGPWGKKPEVEFCLFPASILALVEEGEDQWIIPCGWDEELDPASNKKSQLFMDEDEAAAGARRLARIWND